nr:hypothetical protein [Pandoravirus belohorizontensis]
MDKIWRSWGFAFGLCRRAWMAFFLFFFPLYICLFYLFFSKKETTVRIGAPGNRDRARPHRKGSLLCFFIRMASSGRFGGVPSRWRRGRGQRRWPGDGHKLGLFVTIRQSADNRAPRPLALSFVFFFESLNLLIFVRRQKHKPGATFQD